MPEFRRVLLDRKSTRLNSSHTLISYAVFCLKKKSHPLPRICPIRLDAAPERAAVVVPRVCPTRLAAVSHVTPLVAAGGQPVRFFFFNDTATTEIYTLSLHDALPI